VKRVVASTILVVLLGFSAVTLSAASRPVLRGLAGGIELCPQFICGFALFAGKLEGELNSRPVNGGFVAAITHEDLPDVLGVADITGGQWTIRAGLRLLRGDVAGGSILNLNGTQFCVSMRMAITDGGTGDLYFTGLLDHGPFPPTIGGVVTQFPVPCSAILPSDPV
jgi:hypothetical protein